MAENAAPLTQAEFAALLDTLGPFEPQSHMAVAVSGGPDSMALALLTHRWAHARGGAVVGLVVDHGLREESAHEAAQACHWLERLGIAGQILTWAARKPTTGIQAAARAARMELLAAACRQRSILHLLLAHHRDDQAETVALRQAAGSGPTGLAGMAAVRELPGVRLLRPLLAIPKARLLATLAAAGQPWLVDPANQATRFARGRLRADPSFTSEEPWARSGALAAARTSDDAALAALLARSARPDPLGFVRLGRADWQGLEPVRRADLLGRILASVAGRHYPVSPAALRRLAEAGWGTRATLAGCIIVCRGDDLLVAREPGRIGDRLMLEPAASGLWDRRWNLRHERGRQPVEVRALGARGARMLDAGLRGRLHRAGMPATVVHGLPGAWVGPMLVGCPPLAPFGLPASEDFSLVALLRPALPLASASFRGVNVVSNPQQPIYRPATARVLTGQPASAVIPDEPPRPTSRRTQ